MPHNSNTHARHARGPLRHARRGAAVVEAALVIGIFLTLMLALFDYARLIMIRQVADHAVREGARSAIVNTTSYSTSTVQTLVTNNLAGQSITGLVINVYQADPTSGANLGSWTNAGLGQCIAVEVTGSCQPLFPNLSLLPSSVPISAKAVMYCEAN